jgi:hypothetical protein
MFIFAIAGEGNKLYFGGSKTHMVDEVVVYRFPVIEWMGN